MTLPFDDKTLAAITAPVTFLSVRASLVSERRAAERLQVPDETLREVDQLLAETEEATCTLLLRRPLPEDGYLDPIFDDEFLELCRMMGVNVIAWVNQPQILVHLRDPDAILSRWVALPESDDFGTATTVSSWVDTVAEMEQTIEALFAILKERGAI